MIRYPWNKDLEEVREWSRLIAGLQAEAIKTAKVLK